MNVNVVSREDGYVFVTSPDGFAFNQLMARLGCDWSGTTWRVPAGRWVYVRDRLVEAGYDVVKRMPGEWEVG